MDTSVKGIQYFYQIDFFNQVPTRVKSQVHDLPVLSVPQPTPVDNNTVRENIVLNSEDRFIYSGVKAAPTIAASDSPQLPESRETLVRAAPSIAPFNSPNEILAETSVAEPPQITRKTPAEDLIGRPASIPGAQTTPPFRPDRPDLAAPPANELPREDATPDQSIKVIPRAEFNRAMRAYKPDAGSFLQPGGYEKQDFERSQFFAEPETGNAAALSINSPLESSFLPGETENQAQKIEAQQPELPVEPAFRGISDPDYEPDKSFAAQNQLKGENFLARQAFRLYEMISSTGILNTGNQVDFYF